MPWGGDLSYCNIVWRSKWIPAKNWGIQCPEYRGVYTWCNFHHLKLLSQNNLYLKRIEMDIKNGVITIVLPNAHKTDMIKIDVQSC